MDSSELEKVFESRRELLKASAASRERPAERIEKLEHIARDALSDRRVAVEALPVDGEVRRSPLEPLIDAAFTPLPAIPKAKPGKKARAKKR